MSATRHDAFPERSAQLLAFDVPGLDAAESTEDIAEEVTSELAGSAQQAPSMPRADAAAADAVEGGEPSPTVGSVLRDRYLLEAAIGGGGTAMVYRAVDRRRDDAKADGPRVAVKLLRPERRGDPRSIARLQREFRQTQSAAHPNVVRFLDLDCDQGTWFIVMELLSGESLAAALRRTAPAGLPRARALAVVAGVADALTHAHARGVVHGDVKPANVFVTESGDARLLDFGVAPAPGDPSEPVAATRAYASPEVRGGAPAGIHDDVFSFACVACEALAGEHPFGRGRAMSAGSPGVQPRRPAGLEDATWQLLQRALEGRPSLRPDMHELARALHDAAEPGRKPPPAVAAPTAAPVTAASGISLTPAKHRRLALGAALAATLALVLGILIGRFDNSAGSPPVQVPVSRAEVTQAPMLPLPAAAAADPATVRRPAAGEPQIPQDEADLMAPAPAGEVGFDLSAMSVSNQAVVAAIPLRHETPGGVPRDARVNWRIIDGSARPGQDFGGPQSGVETFVAGNTFRMLYVPIVANPATTRDRTFVVELTGASPGVQLGRTPRIAVTILGDR